MGMASLGALSAYQFYGNLFLKNPTQTVWPLLMTAAGKFLAKVNTADTDIQSTITSFMSVVKYDNEGDIQATFSAFCSWMTTLKSKGLPSSTSVNNWINSNCTNFNATQLTSQQNLTYNFYSDLFFMLMFTGPLAVCTEAYFSPSFQNNKQLASALLQYYGLYSLYDVNQATPFGPGDPNWNTFADQAKDFYIGLNLPNQGSNYAAFYSNLAIAYTAILSGAIPDPYIDFRDYFSSNITNNPNINTPFWNSLGWSHINNDLNGVQYMMPQILEYQTILNGTASSDEKYTQLTAISSLIISTVQTNYPDLYNDVGPMIQSAISMSNFNPNFGIYLPDSTGAPNGGQISGSGGAIISNPQQGNVRAIVSIGIPPQSANSENPLVGTLGSGNSKGTLWLPDPNLTVNSNGGESGVSWETFINWLADQDVGTFDNGILWMPAQQSGTGNDPKFFYNTRNRQSPQFQFSGFLDYSQCFVSDFSSNNNILTDFIEAFTQCY